MVPARPFRGFSARSGMSSTTTASVPAAASMRRAISAPTAGWTMALSSFSASASPNTMAARAGRSSSPSGRRTPGPKRSAMAASTGRPGRCSSRVMASASTMTAPRAASSADTVDLPEPMPPVSPTRITAGAVGGWRQAWSVAASASGSAAASAGAASCGSAAASCGSAAASCGSAEPPAARPQPPVIRPQPPVARAEANRRAGSPRHPHRAPRSTRPRPLRARRRR